MRSMQLLLLITACAALGAAAPARAATNELRKIAKGTVSAITQARHVVIRDPVQWQLFWREHTGRGRPEGGARIPTVDFDKEMVVAVTMGRRPTGGYAIEITKVEPQEEDLRVSVYERRPPKGAMVIQMLTAPFHFVAVPKCGGKPKFVEHTGPPPREAGRKSGGDAADKPAPGSEAIGDEPGPASE